MKTKAFYAVAASALMLASCANEDVVSPNAALQDGEAVMGFSMKTKNLTRDNENDGTKKYLKDLHKDFGVWAVKADDQDDVTGVNLTSDENLVMRNYLVGYVGTGTGEYNVPTEQEKFQSKWVYENLGSSQGITEISNEPSQYLKYWDFNKKNTYYFAYTPYVKGSYTPTFVPSYAENQSALEFQAGFNMTASVAAENAVPMYAGKRELNSNHKQTVYKDNEATQNQNFVDIEFRHLLAQLKIAVIENVPGYKVQLLDVELDNTDRNGATATLDANSYDQTNKLGIVAYPAKLDGANYVEGNILKSAKPVVVFDIPTGDGTQVLNSTVTFDDDKTMDGKYFRFALPTDAQDGNGTKALDGNTYLYETRANRAFSGTTYTVIPNNYNYTDPTKANTGLQFVFNFKLVAEDTGEVIIVKNARAFVDPQYTKWAANTIYTYTFRIEKNTTGTTENITPPERPDNPGKALYPIVFDSITVAEWSTVEDPGANAGEEFPVN